MQILVIEKYANKPSKQRFLIFLASSPREGVKNPKSCGKRLSTPPPVPVRQKALFADTEKPHIFPFVNFLHIFSFLNKKPNWLWTTPSVYWQVRTFYGFFDAFPIKRKAKDFFYGLTTKVAKNKRNMNTINANTNLFLGYIYDINNYQ